MARMEWCPPPPKDIPEHYELGGYPRHQLTRIAKKYLSRGGNIRRAWTRINHHLPETLSCDEVLDIIEFSTAHGAMLELWRHAGHRVRGTDFDGWPESYNHRSVPPKHLKPTFEVEHTNPRQAENSGWVYQPIIESLALDVDLFDASQVSYSYADKSFDVVCCYQAIEAYAHPERWGEIVDEFCRIARRTVVVGFNNSPKVLRNDMIYMASFRAAVESLRRYDRNGFYSVFLEFGETGGGFHPTTLKLMAR